nr:hypothetical protein [Candidatus Sigynarchaeum springense]
MSPGTLPPGARECNARPGVKCLPPRAAGRCRGGSHRQVPGQRSPAAPGSKQARFPRRARWYEARRCLYFSRFTIKKKPISRRKQTPPVIAGESPAQVKEKCDGHPGYQQQNRASHHLARSHSPA